jgi:flagellar biosynthesis/type III secretory pathway chaperone
MPQTSGFFGLLSAAIMGRESAKSSMLDSISSTEKTILGGLTNQYQQLFEQLNKLDRSSEGLPTAETLAQQYAAVFAYYQQEIEDYKCCLDSSKDLPERYYKLAQKYAQKLAQNNLSAKQRDRYKKLSNQYANVSKQYNQAS